MSVRTISLLAAASLVYRSSSLTGLASATIALIAHRWRSIRL